MNLLRSLATPRGRVVLALAAASASAIALASVAIAASNDPPGANGTVKIDGAPLDGRIDNERTSRASSR